MAAAGRAIIDGGEFQFHTGNITSRAIRTKGKVEAPWKHPCRASVSFEVYQRDIEAVDIDTVPLSAVNHRERPSFFVHIPDERGTGGGIP